MDKKDVVTKRSLGNLVREVKAWFGRVGLTKEEADGKYAPIVAPKLRGSWSLFSSDGDSKLAAFIHTNSSSPYNRMASYGRQMRLSAIEEGFENGNIVQLQLHSTELVLDPGGTARLRSGVTEDNKVKLEGLAAPEEENDAANKKYVDEHRGLTEEEADGRYLKLAGGELEPEAEITQTNGKMKLNFSAVNGLLTEQNEPDGISYYTYINPGVIGVGDNDNYTEIGINYAVLNGVDFSCDNERNLNISAGRILGVPTVTDAVEDSEYTDQNSDAASVGYVRQAISAAIGDINAILDAINGEVV